VTPLPDGARFLAVNIPVGDHITRHGLNIDTIYTTLIACAVVLGTGFYLARKASVQNPGRLQLFWETIVGTVQDQVESSLGPQYRRVVPLGVTIFILVLAADWIEILPGLFHNTDYLPSPTADVNLCYALAIVVFIWTNAESFRKKGIGGYLKQFFRKPTWMFPLHVLEELVKPITLSLRLFGNLFAGGIMIALLISFIPQFYFFSIIFTPIWKLFDMFIGVIQAFIFALLTILYFQFATEEGGH
jgi:F-type H+-transporting ATPase subunit a